MSGCQGCASGACTRRVDASRSADAGARAGAGARPPRTSRRRTDNDIKILHYNLEYNRMFYLYTHTTFIPAIVSAALARIPYEIPGRVSCDHADRVSSATDATLTRGASRCGPRSPAVRPAPTAPHTHTVTAHIHTCVRTCLYTRRYHLINLQLGLRHRRCRGFTQPLPKQGRRLLARRQAHRRPLPELAIQSPVPLPNLPPAPRLQVRRPQWTHRPRPRPN